MSQRIIDHERREALRLAEELAYEATARGDRMAWNLAKIERLAWSIRDRLAVVDRIASRKRAAKRLAAQRRRKK